MHECQLKTNATKQLWHQVSHVNLFTFNKNCETVSLYPTLIFIMNLPKNKRINQDIIALINNKHVVRATNLNKFTVLLHGPSDTPYKNGVWIISVTVDDEYPFKPPIVKFKTRIYHPNIDRENGAICMNVLHETWSPIFDMLNIFEQFLPQLLKYPNPDDPLNVNAAQLILHKPDVYEHKVLRYVRRYAHEKLNDYESEDIEEDKDDTSSSSFSDSPSHVFDESLAEMVD